MRIFVEGVDMDWNPCPDPVKDPPSHPRWRPVAARRSPGKHSARIDHDARRAASLPQHMT